MIFQTLSLLTQICHEILLHVTNAYKRKGKIPLDILTKVSQCIRFAIQVIFIHIAYMYIQTAEKRKMKRSD